MDVCSVVDVIKKGNKIQGKKKRHSKKLKNAGNGLLQCHNAHFGYSHFCITLLDPVVDDCPVCNYFYN